MLRVGRVLKDHLVPGPPAMGKGHVLLDQFAQGLIQPSLKHCQNWGIHNIPGQPVPISYQPYSKEFFPKILQIFPLFQFAPITHCPITAAPAKESLSSFPVAPSGKVTTKSSYNLLFSRLYSPHFLILSS